MTFRSCRSSPTHYGCSTSISEVCHPATSVDALNLLILFGWSFAAATILPLSSEVPLALVVRNSGHWLVPVIVATAGNTLGACTTYWLARAAVTVVPPRGERTRRASALLAKYGAPSMLLSWVPLIGDVLVLLAGAARIPVWSFVIWTTVGKASRYVIVALAVDRF
jgi:membrane protein YqaA with SNARE-associated domain